MNPMRYLQGYPETTLAQVQALLTEDRAGTWLLGKYPQSHGVRTDRALYDYVQGLKQAFLRSGEALSKVAFDNKLHVVKNEIGRAHV